MANYFDILKNVCVLAHEEKPYSFSLSSSPYAEIKKYINEVLEEVCTKYYWRFRERGFSMNTVAGQAEYSFSAGVEASEIIKDGIRVSTETSPIVYIPHNEMDTMSSVSGKPLRYSVYAGKLILSPVPDAVYSLKIKYLTLNFAYNSDKTVEKPRLESEGDMPIIPERYIKVIEWGAYSLLRQNYKPDNKYRLAREKYIEFLLDMQKNDLYSGDASPRIVLGTSGM